MADDVLRHLLLGFIRLHVLYHADKEPVYGAELMEELRRHGYRIGPGTLYPMLRQLHAAGYLAPEDAVVHGKRRVNYTITANGKRLLRQSRDKLRELADEILDDRDQSKPATQRPGSSRRR